MYRERDTHTHVNKILGLSVIISLFRLVYVVQLLSGKFKKKGEDMPQENSRHSKIVVSSSLLPFHQEAVLFTKAVLERGSFHSSWELRVEEDERCAVCHG